MSVALLVFLSRKEPKGYNPSCACLLGRKLPSNQTQHCADNAVGQIPQEDNSLINPSQIFKSSLFSLEGGR